MALGVLVVVISEAGVVVGIILSVIKDEREWHYDARIWLLIC